MTHEFAGKNYLVTGSTQGLGKAIALTLAKRGAKAITITGRNEARGQAVVKEIEALGCQAYFFAANLEKVSECQDLVQHAVQAMDGTLHGLVNSAGTSQRGTIMNTGEELYDFIFAVNVRAPFFLMQEALKNMVEQKTEGAVVNIITMSSHGGQSFLTPYAASKAALVGLTKNVAFSALRNRIKVNGLNIGWMDSDGEHQIQKAAHNAPDDWLAKAESERPFGRLLKPDEVAKTVAFLLSSESGMMTGSIVDLDQTVIGCADSSPVPNHKLSL